VDADSRNIEELKVTADPEKFQPRKSTEEMAELQAAGMPFRDYEGMMPEMEKGTLVIDDLSHHEMDRLLELYKPDIYCAGIKEKFSVQKQGIPCKQLHSYDYGGPYAAFQGAINYYREIDRMLHTRAWKLVASPWDKALEPQIEAAYGCD